METLETSLGDKGRNKDWKIGLLSIIIVQCGGILENRYTTMLRAAPNRLEVHKLKRAGKSPLKPAE